MKHLEKINQGFPLSWANLDCLPESKGEKKEIYLIKDDNVVSELILLFYSLFSDFKNDINVYNSSWWDYCLDTWNIDKDENDYSLSNKSQETKDYLTLISDSSIEIGYSGSCKCYDWDKCLFIILQCLISHVAPYSPIFYDEKNDFFFYFHHSGSIGIYYRTWNVAINHILTRAEAEYEVK